MGSNLTAEGAEATLAAAVDDETQVSGGRIASSEEGSSGNAGPTSAIFTAGMVIIRGQYIDDIRILTVSGNWMRGQTFT